MKIIFTLLCLANIACAQQHQPPVQLSITQTCLKIMADPIYIPTAAVTYCTYNVCNLPYPYACAAGTSASCAGLYYITQADPQIFDYYSVRALAALKSGLFSVFPCMQAPISVTKKTE